jgi:hypothetical protein
VIGAVGYPYLHRSRSVEEIGVPVGVPVAESTNSVPHPVASPSPVYNNNVANARSIRARTFSLPSTSSK